VKFLDLAGAHQLEVNPIPSAADGNNGSAPRAVGAKSGGHRTFISTEIGEKPGSLGLV
jgi:hypothetical protein